MIYRSRYLNRLLFSPLGYRDQQYRDQQVPERQSHRQAPVLEPRREAPRSGTNSGQGGLESTQVELGDQVRYLSSRELRDIVGRCEHTITSGQAQIEDYEAFVICQQELTSRV